MIRVKRQRITESLTPDAIADALKNLQRKDPLRYREFVEDWKDTIPEAEEHNLPVAPEFKNWIHSTLHDGKNGYETIKALDADVRKAASGIVEEKMITVKAEKRSAKNPEPEKKAKVVESKKKKRIVEEEEPTYYPLEGKTTIYTRKNRSLSDLPVNTDGDDPLSISFDADECWIGEGPGRKEGDAGVMIELSTKNLLKIIRTASSDGYIPKEWLTESKRWRDVEDK